MHMSAAMGGRCEGGDNRHQWTSLIYVESDKHSQATREQVDDDAVEGERKENKEGRKEKGHNFLSCA